MNIWKLIGTIGVYFLVVPAFVAIFVSYFTKEPEKPEKHRFTDWL